MKKLSLLIALCMLISIGGVYAAWYYPGTSVASVDRTISHGVSGKQTEGSLGTLSFESIQFLVTIDPTSSDPENMNYLAKILLAGTARIRFTPHPGAHEDDITAALGKMYLDAFIDNADQFQYEGKPIYVSTGNKTLIPSGDWVAQGDGSYIAEIDTSDIANLFALGGAFVLDDVEKYDTFHGLESKLTISLRVSQGN